MKPSELKSIGQFILF